MPRQHSATGSPPSAALRMSSKDSQVVPVDHLNAPELAGLDLGRLEGGDASGKFRAVQVADPHHVAGGEFALAPRNARRQQALAAVSQRLARPRVHKHRPPRMMKKGNPPLAPLEPPRVRHEKRPLFLPRYH